MLNVFGAAVAMQNYLAGKMLKVNFVAPATTIKAEEQDNRTMHHGGEQNRAGRKFSGRA